MERSIYIHYQESETTEIMIDHLIAMIIVTALFRLLLLRRVPVEDATEDCWHKEQEFIWRKTQNK